MFTYIKENNANVLSFKKYYVPKRNMYDSVSDHKLYYTSDEKKWKKCYSEFYFNLTMNTFKGLQL